MKSRKRKLVITQRQTLAGIRKVMPRPRQIIESEVVKRRAKRNKKQRSDEYDNI